MELHMEFSYGKLSKKGQARCLLAWSKKGPANSDEIKRKIAWVSILWLHKAMADLDNSFVDEYNWPLCTNREEHRVEKMFLAQVIPKNALLDLGNKMHQVRAKWKLAQFCHKFGENISSGQSGQAGMIQEFKVSPAEGLTASFCFI